MGHRKICPHKTDDFWINECRERLKNPYISDGYRARLQKILDESLANFTAHNKQNSLHYPMVRK